MSRSSAAASLAYYRAVASGMCHSPLTWVGAALGLRDVVAAVVKPYSAPIADGVSNAGIGPLWATVTFIGLIVFAMLKAGREQHAALEKRVEDLSGELEGMRTRLSVAKERIRWHGMTFRNLASGAQMTEASAVREAYIACDADIRMMFGAPGSLSLCHAMPDIGDEVAFKSPEFLTGKKTVQGFTGVSGLVVLAQYLDELASRTTNDDLLPTFTRFAANQPGRDGASPVSR